MFSQKNIQKIKILKIISLTILGPFLFYPFIFCPFGVPYLYCSICYLKCLWGKLRGILLLGILGLNLKKRFYCIFLCPCGTIGDLQYKIKTKKFILPSFSYYIKYFLLGLVIFILVTKRNFSFIINEYIFWFFIGLVFVFSFFIHRFWCFVFCPGGALSDIFLRIRDKGVFWFFHKSKHFLRKKK